jgi:hypothetical protein
LSRILGSAILGWQDSNQGEKRRSNPVGQASDIVLDRNDRLGLKTTEKLLSPKARKIFL